MESIAQGPSPNYMNRLQILYLQTSEYKSFLNVWLLVESNSIC